MSRYQPLADFLSAQKGREWEATFADIEKRLGFALPRSAYKYPAWWANQNGEGHSQTKGWRSVGWRTARLDLERRRVTFERERSGPRAGHGSDELEDLVRKAREMTGIDDRELLFCEAFRSLIAREAGRRLMELGGTMPDLKVPPRRRPPY
jgi:hypothetical protein